MKKNNNYLIYISPIKIRDYDWQNRELGVLEKKKLKIILHEIVEIIRPGFTKIFLNPSVKKKIFFFNSLKKWKKEIIKLKKSKKKIKIMIHMNAVNFKSFLILKFLKQEKIEIISVTSPGHPLKNHPINLKFIIYKFYFLLRNPATILILVETIFFSFFKKLFKLNPTYAFQAGSKHFYNEKKTTKIIKANSSDFSNYLILKKKTNNIKRKFALFLEQPTPLFDGDNFYQKFNKNEFGTAEKWYPSLNIFFEYLEDFTKTKIKVAAHPKVRHPNKPIYYGKREVINQNFIKASFSSKFLISMLSTGLGLCSVHKIPALFVHSDETSRNLSFINKQKHYASELGTVPINIDNKFNDNEIKKALKINKIKFNTFKFNYLTSRKDSKTNSTIIKELY